MGWFSVSLLVAYKPKVEDPDGILVEEQVYLIEASDDNHARQLAADIGREIASVEDCLEIGGQPAKREYVGIRRIVTTQNLYGDADGLPRHGCELTYCQFLVASDDDLKRLATEGDVKVTYIGEY